MASNERDPDEAAGPAPRKRRTEDHALVFGEDWEVPSAPQPKKTAAPPPPVPVPALSGVHDTVESAWSAGSSVPVAPPHLPPKTPFPVPREATASDVHRVGFAVPGGVPTPLGDRVDRFDSQFPNLGAWVYLVRNAPLVLVTAARAVHTTSGGPCVPADRISPPPAPASVRPTPLCHAQSQTRAVVLSLDPLPPAAESPSNGRALPTAPPVFVCPVVCPQPQTKS